MKKFIELGSKTGLGEGELKKFSPWSLAGLIAVCFSALSGCVDIPVRNTTGDPQSSNPGAGVQPVSSFSPQDAARPQSEQFNPAGAGQPVVPPAGMTTPAQAPANNDPAPAPCGPYPGYPCGTRYYTVSPGDFARAFTA